MRALALIDGEHYPPVIRHALDVLRATEGLEFVGAVFLGGTEKLKSSDALQQLGLPVIHEPVLLRGVERGVAELLPEVVVDLSDEPITGYVERFTYAAAALAAGAAYRGADFEFRPPHYERVTSRPSLAVFGTGKRIGKTAVSAYLARWRFRVRRSSYTWPTSPPRMNSTASSGPWPGQTSLTPPPSTAPFSRRR